MNLHGSICALATPFTAADELDLDAYGRLIDLQISGGSSALVVAGSTGEAAALDEKEFDRLIEFAVAHVAGRVTVLAGTGGANTAKTLRTTQRAAQLGVDAALVVVPFYVRPTQEGLYRHYMEIAAGGGVPIVLYNVPSRTGCDLLPATVERLRGAANIVAIKEARADAERMRDLLSLQSGEFAVLSGDDETFARAMLAGAKGVISVAANIVPQRFSALCQACASGRSAEAEALNALLADLYALLSAEPNPIPIKWCLSRLGIMQPNMRLPLLPLSRQFHARADTALASLQLTPVAHAAVA